MPPLAFAVGIVVLLIFHFVFIIAFAVFAAGALTLLLIKRQDAKTGESSSVRIPVGLMILGGAISLPLAFYFLQGGSFYPAPELCLAAFSILVFFTGGLSLIIIRNHNAGREERISDRLPAGMAIVGIIVFWASCSWATISPIPGGYYDDSESQPEVTDCRDLPVAEGYMLQVIRFSDGTQQASLEKADGSQCFVMGITRYAIEGDIMMGEVSLQPNPDHWFWFNLDTKDSDRFSTKSEYLTALQGLGFEEEPELHPVEFYCEKGDCRPCWATPDSTITPTLSPSPTATATLAATP